LLKQKRGWIREPFCGLSHLLGVILSVLGLVVLLVLARGRPWHLAGFAIFGTSLILLYTASTLYHSLPVAPTYIDRLRRFDLVAIFLLIAGTYAPLCLVPLRGAWGWSLLATEYGIALIGSAIVVLRRRGMPDGVRTFLYALMGWLIVVALIPLRHAVSPVVIGWLLAGGIAYSLGAIIFAMDRPHLWPGRFSAHDLWHVFVLAGSASHFVMVMSLVA